MSIKRDQLLTVPISNRSFVKIENESSITVIFRYLTNDCKFKPVLQRLKFWNCVWNSWYLKMYIWY